MATPFISHRYETYHSESLKGTGIGRFSALAAGLNTGGQLDIQTQ